MTYVLPYVASKRPSGGRVALAVAACSGLHRLARQPPALNARFGHGLMRLACGVRKFAGQVVGEQHHEDIKASMASREPGTTDR